MTFFSQHEMTSALVRTAEKNLRRATEAAYELRTRAMSVSQLAARAQLLAHAAFYELEAQRAGRELADLERLRAWRDAEQLRERDAR